MTVTSTLTNINNAITSITYQGNANFNGSDTLIITVDDQGNSGVGGALSHVVNAVNDAPVLTVPSAQAGDEDTAIVINGISIADVDISGGSSELEVILSVSDGTITLASTTGLTFSSGADGSASMTFTGTLINASEA